MKQIFSLSELDRVATEILNQNPQKIILINGQMGVGKTTLIKQLCKKLGVIQTTSSPTFSLVNEYQTADNQVIYHFDFYRLNTQKEALDIGLEDYLYSDNWCFIEWAEKIKNLIPENHSTVDISLLLDDKRELIFS